jgi:hypothetical protein
MGAAVLLLTYAFAAMLLPAACISSILFQLKY